MHGPAGVLTVVLYETALGSLALLWLAPLWGVVRPGFFKLAGATALGCAALAWLAGRGELATAGATGRMAARWLGLFAAAICVWQVLLYARMAAARWAREPARPRWQRRCRAAGNQRGLLRCGWRELLVRGCSDGQGSCR